MEEGWIFPSGHQHQAFCLSWMWGAGDTGQHRPVARPCCLFPPLGSPGPLTPEQSCSFSRPNLISLDLGFNNLTDLQGMIASLSTLPHLRLLVLQGNPLALVPFYRGFTIDSLSRLCVLDDVTVTSKEKHQFRGLGQRGDLLACEAQFVVTIGSVRGVLDTSVLDLEPGPQGPFITYSYYVTYDFVEDKEGEASEYGGVLAELVKPSPSTEQVRAFLKRPKRRLENLWSLG